MTESERMLQILSDRLGLREMDSDAESPDARAIVAERLDPVAMFSSPEEPEADAAPEQVVDPDFSKASGGAQLLNKYGSFQRIDEEESRLKHKARGAAVLGAGRAPEFTDEDRQNLADIQAYLDGEEDVDVGRVAKETGWDIARTHTTVMGLVGKAAIAVPDLASKVTRWRWDMTDDNIFLRAIFAQDKMFLDLVGAGDAAEDLLVRLSEGAQGYNKELGNFMDWHRESLYERGGAAAVMAYDVGVKTAETVISLKAAQFLTGAAYGTTAMKGAETARHISLARKLGLITKDTASFVKSIHSTRDAIASTTKLLQSGTAAKVGARLIHGLKMAGVMQAIKPSEGVDFDPERAAKDYFISAAYMTTPAVSGLFERWAPLADVLINSGITAGLGKHREAWARGLEEGDKMGMSESEAFAMGVGNVFMEASTDVLFGMKTLGYGLEAGQAQARLGIMQEKLHIAVREASVIDSSMRTIGTLVKGSMIETVERDTAHKLENENLTAAERQVIRNEGNIRIADINSRPSDKVVNSVIAKAINSKEFPQVIERLRGTLDRRLGVKAGTVERLRDVDLPAAESEAREVKQAESMKLHKALPYMMKNMDVMPIMPEYGSEAFKAYDQFRQKLADDFAEVIRPEQAEQLRDSFNNPQLDVWKIVESHIGKDKFMSQNQFQRQYSEMSKTWRDQFFGTKKALVEGKISEILETMREQKTRGEEYARISEALSPLESIAMSNYKNGQQMSRREAKLNQAKLEDGVVSEHFGSYDKPMQEAHDGMKRAAVSVVEMHRLEQEKLVLDAKAKGKVYEPKELTPEEVYNTVAERIVAGDRFGLGDKALDYVREKVVPVSVIEPERVEEGVKAAGKLGIVEGAADAAKATEPTRTAEPEAARPDAAPAAEPAKPPIPHNLKPFVDTSDKYLNDYMTKQKLERYGFSLDNLRESHGKLTENAVADIKFLDGEIGRVVDGILKETFGDRILTQAENETLSRFQHAVQLKTPPNELPADVKVFYDKMRAQYDVMYDMVNERRVELGMAPLPKIPDYAPFLRKGQLSEVEYADADARGSTGDIDRIYSMFEDPASMHHRSPLKEWDLYEGDATKAFLHYNRSMLGWLMLHRAPGHTAKRLMGGELTPFEKTMLNFDAVSDRMAAEFDQLREMVGGVGVIHARAAWAKAQAEGKDVEKLNDLERYGSEIEQRIESVRDTMQELGVSRDMFDVMSPTRAVEISTLDDWNMMHGYGRISKLEVNTENPWQLVSRIDNQWLKSAEENGPVTKMFEKAQEGVLRKAQIDQDTKSALVKNVLEDVYKKKINTSENKAINKRLTKIYEYHREVQDKRKLARMTNEQLAQVIRTVQDGDISGADVKAYRKIMNSMMEMRAKYDTEIRILSQVKDKAFRAPRVFSLEKKLFFGMIESTISRIALAASQADNIDSFLRASEYFRDTATGIDDSRLRISEWMSRYATEALAHGMHPIDERVANVGKNKSLQRMDEEKETARNKVSRWFSNLNRDKGSIALELMQGGSALISTRYLLGNPKWNFSRQWLSFGSIPATTSLTAALGSLSRNTVIGLSSLAEEVGLGDTATGRYLAAKDARLFHSMNALSVQIKNMTRSGMSGAELDMARHELNQSYMHKLKGYSSWLGHTMENVTNAGAYQAGISEGLRRGMSGSRLQYFANMTVATTQSMYNRESRALLLNSVVWRAVFPFQTFAFDASRALTSEWFREDDDKRERFAQLARAAIGLGMTEVVSQTFFRRSAFKGVATFIPGVLRVVDIYNQAARQASEGESVSESVWNVVATTPANVLPFVEMLRSGPWKAARDFVERGDDESVEAMVREFGATSLALAGVGGAQLWSDGWKAWQAMENHSFMPWRPHRDRELKIIDEGMGWATLKDWLDLMVRVPMHETDTARKDKQQRR